MGADVIGRAITIFTDAFQKKGVPQALANPRKSKNKSKIFYWSKIIRDDKSVVLGDIRVLF